MEDTQEVPTTHPRTGVVTGDAEPARNPPSFSLKPTEGRYDRIGDAGCAGRSVCSGPRQPMIDAGRHSQEGAERCGSIPEAIADPVSRRYSPRMGCDGNGSVPEESRKERSGPGHRNGRKSAICATDSGIIVRIVQCPNRPKCMLFTPRNTIPICTDCPGRITRTQSYYFRYRRMAHLCDVGWGWCAGIDVGGRDMPGTK